MAQTFGMKVIGRYPGPKAGVLAFQPVRFILLWSLLWYAPYSGDTITSGSQLSKQINPAYANSLHYYESCLYGKKTAEFDTQSYY